MRILMRLLPFLAVLIVGAGTMLLGLDLMTLPQTPAPRSLSAPNKLAQHEADQRAEKTEGDVSRPLTPLYPANPGGAKDVRMVYPPNNQPSDQTPAKIATTGAAPVSEQKANVAAAAGSNASAEPQQTQGAEPQEAHKSAAPPAQKLQAAKAEEPSAQKPAQDVGLKSASNHCDVQACTNAYSSFRAADCTYQPFEGPRRACITPPAQHSAARVQPRATVPAYTQREVEPRPAEPANVTVDDDDDPDAAGFIGGRRVIILDRNYRPWH
jgi:BA14K-like protein